MMQQETKPNLIASATEVVLVKSNQHWVFRYDRGQETAALRCIAQAAGDPSKDLDWADAAALARQMGFRFSPSTKELP